MLTPQTEERTETGYEILILVSVLAALMPISCVSSFAIFRPLMKILKLSDPTIARQLPIDTICALTGVHLTGRAVRRRNPETLRSLQPLGLEVMFAASAAECACVCRSSF